MDTKPLVIFIGKEVFKNAEFNCGMTLKPIAKEGKEALIVELLPFEQGQYFRIGKHSQTDEGFCQQFYTITFKDNAWFIKLEERSRDCDGVMEYENKSMSTGGYPSMTDQASREDFALEYDEICIGSNQAMVSNSQRDIEAEKAGY